MPPFARTIIREKRPCFFISPHLDDAALSCGGLIAEIASKTEVTIVTVFTDASDKNLTLSAKKALSDAQFPDASSYYEARRQEDRTAFAHLPVTIMHLDEVEALYRLKAHPSPLSQLLGKILPEFLHLYPTYRFHMTSGAVARGDEATIDSIHKKLQAIIPKHGIVFAPYGIGKHVDHLVTNIACESFTPIMWLDQPYLDREASIETETLIKKSTAFPFTATEKQHILSAYTSQMALLFPPSGQTPLNEYYLIPKSFTG